MLVGQRAMATGGRGRSVAHELFVDVGTSRGKPEMGSALGAIEEEPDGGLRAELIAAVADAVEDSGSHGIFFAASGLKHCVRWHDMSRPRRRET